MARKDTSQNNPLVSVIIPLFNTENYILQTLHSVLGQSYRNIEILVVNDGSTDGSVANINKFIKDKRLQVINKKNSGVSAARNTGIEHAKGEFLAFLDADDLFEKDNILEKVKAIKLNSNVDYVFADMTLIDSEGKFIENRDKGTDQDMLNKLLLWEQDVVACPSGNYLIRKHCFNNELKFDTCFSTAADQDFAIQLAKRYKGLKIKRSLIKYRYLPNSMGKNIPLLEKDHIGVYRKAEKNNLFHSLKFKKKCFSNLYLIIAGCWWKDANNKLKAMHFILKSLYTYPANISKLTSKLTR